jgi:exopolysaccharide biosynthesis operon protein EpsL
MNTYSLRLIPLAVLLCGSASLWAQTEDPLTLSAGYAIQTDSNLFRLPANANTLALIGTSDASEQIGIATLGINFKTRQSLQQFELRASVSDYQYQHFNYLSYTAANFDGAWRWSITPRWHGGITASRKETLNNFSDYQGFNQRNLRLDTASSLYTEYEIDGPWRLVGGLYSNRESNQSVQVSGSDFNNTSADVGVSYAFASGSSIALRTRTNQGDYLNKTVPSAGLYDNAYSQTDQDLRLHWVTGNTTADANLTYVARSHPNYPQRDYSGFNTGAAVNLQLSGKTSLTAAYQHQLGSYQTASSNYSQTDSVSLGPVWQISPKVVMRLQYRVDQVDYLGTPAAAVLTARRDTNRETTLSVNWQPYQKLNLGATFATLARSSNQAGLDFDSTQLGLNAQYLY